MTGFAEGAACAFGEVDADDAGAEDDAGAVAADDAGAAGSTLGAAVAIEAVAEGATDGSAAACARPSEVLGVLVVVCREPRDSANAPTPTVPTNAAATIHGVRREASLFGFTFTQLPAVAFAAGVGSAGSNVRAGAGIGAASVGASPSDGSEDCESRRGGLARSVAIFAFGENGASAEIISCIDTKRSAGDFAIAFVMANSKSPGISGRSSRTGVGVSPTIAAPIPAVDPLNGVSPVSSSYKMTPSDQTSVRASTLFAERTCSGDM